MHAYLMILELFPLAVSAWFAYRRSEVGCEVREWVDENSRLNHVSKFIFLAKPYPLNIPGKN